MVVGVFEYLTDVTPLRKEVWEKAEKELGEEGILKEGEIMNIREHLREKGVQEGLEKGRKEVVLNMLKEKAEISFISKVTGLSEKEIKTIKKEKNKF